MTHPSDPRRVLIVQPVVAHYRLPFFKKLARALPASEIRVVASPTDVTGECSAAQLPDGIDASRPMFRLIGDVILWQPVVSDTLRLRRRDVLVVNGNPHYISTLLSLVLARFRGIPTVWWGHGWTAGSVERRAALRRWIMRLPDRLLLYTDAERDEYIARGFHPSRVHAANNAVDQREIREARRAWNAEDLASFVRRENLPAHRYLVFVGRLTRKARLDLLLEALANVSSRGRSVPLVVIGEGSERAALETRVQAMGLDVRFLGALHGGTALAPWFLAARGFVYPGAVGLSLLTAFGFGCPAIVHGDPRGHMPEFAAFEDGVNGFAFRRDDASSLAREMERLLDLDEPSWKRLRAAAQRTADVDYTLDGMVARVAAAIRGEHPVEGRTADAMPFARES